MVQLVSCPNGWEYNTTGLFRSVVEDVRMYRVTETLAFERELLSVRCRLTCDWPQTESIFRSHIAVTITQKTLAQGETGLQFIGRPIPFPFSFKNKKGFARNKFQEFVTNIWQNKNGNGIGRTMNWRRGTTFCALRLEFGRREGRKSVASKE